MKLSLYPEKATLVDGDSFAGPDSENSNATTRWLWSTIKAALDTLYQPLSSALTALSTKFTPASSSGPASLQFHEDTDNGTNKGTLIAPASMASDRTWTMPNATGTVSLVITKADDAARLADTTLPAGVAIYQTDTGQTWIRAIAASPEQDIKLAAVPVMRVLEADFSKTNNTLANITDWSVDVLAGHWYRVILDCVIESVDVGYSKMDFAGGSCTATGAGGSYMTGDFATNAVTSNGISSVLSGTITGASTAGESSSIQAVFIVQINAGGTFIPRFAQFTTNANASILKKYSTLQVIDVTP